MCDGTYAYPSKHGAKVILKNPIVIICGNAPPDQVYPKAHPFIQARFNVHQVYAPIPAVQIPERAPQVPQPIQPPVKEEERINSFVRNPILVPTPTHAQRYAATMAKLYGNKQLAGKY